MYKSGLLAVVLGFVFSIHAFISSVHFNTYKNLYYCILTTIINPSNIHLF